MISLRDLQRHVGRALGGNDDLELGSLIVAHGVPASVRLGIYRNNVRMGFRAAMQLGYPATNRLVGGDYFDQLVSDYQAAHPSRRGNLQHVGCEFPGFLGRRFAATPYAYLADVAAIEWAYQEVLVAPEHGSLDLRSLAAIPEDDCPALRLGLHPAVRIVHSVFPVVRIWRANRAETLDGSPIDLSCGGEAAALFRRGLEVEIHRLGAAERVFLDTLARGDPLGEALEVATAAEPATDPAPLLGRYVSLGLIARVLGVCPRAPSACAAPGPVATPAAEPRRCSSAA